jgi:hypothetical protein
MLSCDSAPVLLDQKIFRALSLSFERCPSNIHKCGQDCTCHRGTRLRAGRGGSAAERALLFGVSGRFGRTRQPTLPRTYLVTINELVVVYEA